MSVPEEGASTTAGVSERQHHNRVAQRHRLRSLTALRWRPPLKENLVTCDDDNVGSRTVIERAGGVLEDVRDGKRRYWISR